jgi:hypothetical protein
LVAYLAQWVVEISSAVNKPMIPGDIPGARFISVCRM